MSIVGYSVLSGPAVLRTIGVAVGAGVAVGLFVGPGVAVALDVAVAVALGIGVGSVSPVGGAVGVAVAAALEVAVAIAVGVDVGDALRTAIGLPLPVGVGLEEPPEQPAIATATDTRVSAPRERDDVNSHSFRGEEYRTDIEHSERTVPKASPTPSQKRRLL